MFPAMAQRQRRWTSLALAIAVAAAVLTAALVGPTAAAEVTHGSVRLRVLYLDNDIYDGSVSPLSGPVQLNAVIDGQSWCACGLNPAV